MKKIAVIGNSASGKSTFCKLLRHRLPMSFLEIDDILWTPDWQMVPTDEYDAAHDAFISKESWLIDGVGSWSSVLKRLDAADTIVFFDMPLWRHYWWTTKRQLWDRKNGVSWPMTFKLYKMMWQMHKDLPPKIITELAQRNSTCKIYTLRSPIEVRALCMSIPHSGADYPVR